MAHAVVTHRRYYFDVLDQILVYLCGDGNWQPIGGNNPMTVKEIAAVIPATSLSDVLSFRQVNRKWNDAYRLRFEPRPTVLKLPAELVDKIVEYLAPRKAWPKEQKLIENRSTLSLESFSENREPRPPLEENPLKTFVGSVSLIFRFYILLNEIYIRPFQMASAEEKFQSASNLCLKSGSLVLLSYKAEKTSLEL